MTGKNLQNCIPMEKRIVNKTVKVIFFLFIIVVCIVIAGSVLFNIGGNNLLSKVLMILGALWCITGIFCFFIWTPKMIMKEAIGLHTISKGLISIILGFVIVVIWVSITSIHNLSVITIGQLIHWGFVSFVGCLASIVSWAFLKP
jgi:hypothetical protein